MLLLVPHVVLTWQPPKNVRCKQSLLLWVLKSGIVECNFLHLFLLTHYGVQQNSSFIFGKSMVRICDRL
jgi:hypothetical protein